MLSDEPIDEDLEALLYAQVYYGKEQEVELPNLTESVPAQLEKNKEQVAPTSDKTGSGRRFYQKTRYFENNLLQEDKNKDNTNSHDREKTTEAATKESPNIENSVVPSSRESDVLPEKSPQDEAITPNKNQSFELESATNQQFIKISTSSPSTIPSSKESTQFVTTLSTPSDLSHPQLLNNITINQYLFPPSFEEKLRSSLENTPLSKKCKSDLNKLKRGCISEQDFFNRLRRRLKVQRRQQKQIRKIYLKKQKKIAQSEVICLSDSDSSDIEIVEVASSANSKKKSPIMKEKVEIFLEESENEAADDDEIIYVAPPPVPVINIDTESDSSDNDKEICENMETITQAPNNITALQTLSGSQMSIDETSDDFLQPKNTPDNFNFSLHGSDFQNTDFVRPANPTDIYETESSTSTSDFNRDSTRQFCNSVKTIVFNEVEFPNQDIFDENNLDSFGEFITPKRGDKGKNTVVESSCADKPSSSKRIKRVNPRTSSESSSESEYEGSIAHQNLPDLSPMVCEESSPKKSKTIKKSAREQPKKKKGKVGKGHEYNTRSVKTTSKEKYVDNDVTDDAEPAVLNEPMRRSKRRSSGAALGEEEIPRKKSKKKKNKSGSKSAEENENVSEASSSATERSGSPKKNLRHNSIVTSSTPKKMGLEDESDVLNESLKKKSKKKKKHFRNEDDLEVDILRQDVLTVEEKNATEASGKKGKKKKRDSMVNKSSDDGRVIEEQRKVLEENNQALAKDQGNLSEDSGRKKSKKRKQKDVSEPSIISEASSTTNDENALPKRTETEENSSLNKLSKDKESLEDENSILEQNDATETSNKKKNKRKKRTSIEKRSSMDESNISCVENEVTKEKGKEKDENKDENVEEGELVEDGEHIVEVPQNSEADVILIEKVIPVHTIDSSETEEEILSFGDVGDDLELANIAGTTEKLDVVMENLQFDVSYVLSKMPNDPDKWKILPTDRYNLNTTKKGPRCNKCRQFGHISINCPNKPAEPVCTLCGGRGHQEPRCPNKVCFTCGKSGNFSTIYCYMCARQRKNKCGTCSIVGHKTEYCPDLWRRYYLTTTEGPLTVPKKNCPTLKPRHKQWCSGCASNGHLEFECNTYKWFREYPASSPQIFKYNDVYADQRKDKPPAPPVDRRRLDYDKFPTSVRRTQSSLTTPEYTIIHRTDKYQGNTSKERVPETRENRPINELAESLSDITEKQGNFDSQSGQSTTEDHLQSWGANAESVEVNTAHSLLPYTATTQELYANQLQQTFTGQRGRGKQKRKSPRREKINPLSVLRPTGYTPYHSVLNPYSVLGAPSALPPQGLFNQVPGNVLAKQLADLSGTVSNYQNLRTLDQLRSFDQNSYGFPNQGVRLRYGEQIPPNPNPMFSSTSDAYQEYSEFFYDPPPSEHYHNFQEPHGDRGFLDRPHTITRDPTEDRERLGSESSDHRVNHLDAFIEDREGQVSLRGQIEFGLQARRDHERVRGFRDRLGRPRTSGSHSRTSIPSLLSLEVPAPIQPLMNDSFVRQELPVPPGNEMQNPNNNFITLNTVGEENVDIFNKNSRFVNVDESTVKKFNTSSITQLKELLSNDLGKLDRLQQADAKTYKKKLNNIDNLKKIDVKTNAVKKQMYFLFKQINMFLFGVHNLFEGRRNLDYIRQFAYGYTDGVNESRRKGLLQAYGYIFGGEHPDFNYRRYLNTLTVINKK